MQPDDGSQHFCWNSWRDGPNCHRCNETTTDDADAVALTGQEPTPPSPAAPGPTPEPPPPLEPAPAAAPTTAVLDLPPASSGTATVTVDVDAANAMSEPMETSADTTDGLLGSPTTASVAPDPTTVTSDPAALAPLLFFTDSDAYGALVTVGAAIDTSLASTIPWDAAMDVLGLLALCHQISGGQTTEHVSVPRLSTTLETMASTRVPQPHSLQSCGLRPGDHLVLVAAPVPPPPLPPTVTVPRAQPPPTPGVPNVRAGLQELEADSRWNAHCTDAGHGVWAYIRSLHGTAGKIFDWRPPMLDIDRRRKIGLKKGNKSLNSAVAKREFQAEVSIDGIGHHKESTALVLLFERLIYHRCRSAAEIVSGMSWAAIVERRLELFDQGEVRRLAMEGMSSCVTMVDDTPPPDTRSPSEILAQESRKIQSLAERAVREGHLSRGLAKLVAQMVSPLAQDDQEVIDAYTAKVTRTGDEQPEELIGDWKALFTDVHGNLDKSKFRVDTFVPKNGDDQPIDTLNYVVRTLDQTTSPGFDCWSNAILRRLPDLSFLQPVLAIFFQYDDADRLRDDHPFERRLHEALISVRGVALNKDPTGSRVDVRPIGVPSALRQIAISCLLKQADDVSPVLLETYRQYGLAQNGTLFAYQLIRSSLEGLIAAGRRCGALVSDMASGYNRLFRKTGLHGCIDLMPSATILFHFLNSIPHTANLYKSGKSDGMPVARVPIQDGVSCQGCVFGPLAFSFGMAKLTADVLKMCQAGSYVDSSMIASRVTILRSSLNSSTVSPAAADAAFATLDSTTVTEAVLVDAPAYVDTLPWTAAPTVDSGCFVTVLVDNERLRLPWHCVRYQFSPNFSAYLDDFSAADDLIKLRPLRDIMRRAGLPHGANFFDNTKNYIYVPAQLKGDVHRLFGNDAIIFDDDIAHNNGLGRISYKQWVKEKKANGDILPHTLVVNMVGIERLLGWPLRVCIPSCSRVSEAQSHALLAEEAMTDAFLETSLSDTICRVMDQFRTLGLADVSSASARAKQTLAGHNAKLWAGARQLMTDSTSRTSFTPIERTARVRRAEIAAIETVLAQPNAAPPPLAATFADNAIKMLITRYCLTSRLSHFSRALPPKLCSGSSSVVRTVVETVFLSIMERSREEVGQTRIGMITAACADGGLATCDGDDGNACSFVSASAAVERHIISICGKELSDLGDDFSIDSAPALVVAAHRLKQRGQLTANNKLTRQEKRLEQCCQMVNRYSGVRRRDLHPSSYNRVSPTPSASSSPGAPTPPRALVNFLQLAEFSGRRSVLYRGCRAAARNSLRDSSNDGASLAALEMGQRCSNAVITSIIPTSEPTSCVSDAIPALLRNHFVVPEISASDGELIHRCGAHARPITLSSRHNSHHLNSCPGSNALVGPHDECVHALVQVIVASGLVKPHQIFLERRCGNHADDSAYYSDISFRCSNGKEVVIDVSLFSPSRADIVDWARFDDNAVLKAALAREHDKNLAAADWLAHGNANVMHDHRPNPAPVQRAGGTQNNTQTSSTTGVSPRSRVSSAPPASFMSANGSRRVFIAFTASNNGLLLGPTAARFLQDLSSVAKLNGRTWTALNPSHGVAEDLSFTNRSFSSWSRQRVSLAISAAKACAMSDLREHDVLRSTAARNTAAASLHLGRVGYSQESRARLQAHRARRETPAGRAADAFDCVF